MEAGQTNYMKLIVLILILSISINAWTIYGIQELKQNNDDLKNDIETQKDHNEPPIAKILLENPNPIWGNDTMYFSGKESYDTDGSIKSYIWWCEGAGSINGINSRYSLDFQGFPQQKTVTLGVIDDKGVLGLNSMNISILHRPSFKISRDSLSNIIEIKSVYNYVDYTQPEELEFKLWYNGSNVVQGDIGGFEDIDDDGFVSVGDLIDFNDNLKTTPKGTNVLIELTGNEYHNRDTVVASIEFIM